MSCENHHKNGDLDENSSNRNPEENKTASFPIRSKQDGRFDVADFLRKFSFLSLFTLLTGAEKQKIRRQYFETVKKAEKHKIPSPYYAFKVMNM